MQVSADLAGPEVSASDANAAIKAEVLPPILLRYPSITPSYEGQNREVIKSQESIQRVMPLIFALMLFIIILAFRSPLQGLAVFGLIPFGFIGVSLGHWILGAQISLFSILGMIALIGILVNDALVFVAAYNVNLKQGMEVKAAIWEAGMSRFRHHCCRFGSVDAQQKFSSSVFDPNGHCSCFRLVIRHGHHLGFTPHLFAVDQSASPQLGLDQTR